MQVILREKIRNLGDLGEKVNVKPGFARNFLVPKGFAMQATKDNLEKFEADRAELEKAAAAKVATATARAEELSGKTVVINAKTGDSGKLFGSIGTRDIAEALIAAGIEVNKHEVRLPTGVIREIGKYDVVVHVHSDVDATIKVHVKSDGAEEYVDEELEELKAADDAAPEESEAPAVDAEPSEDEADKAE